MLTRITLNGSQVGHGNNLTEALESLTCRIHPNTVLALFHGGEPVTDADGIWDVEREPAFTGQMVRAACESGESFATVMMEMEGVR